MAAFDFPPSPLVNQTYTLNGVTYTWNGTAWVGGPIVDGGAYVLKAGDTMTGNLVIDPPVNNPELHLDKPTSGKASVLRGKMNGADRWAMSFGNTVAESGSNTGSDFSLNRYDDSGTLIDFPISIARNTGVVTANLAIPTAIANRNASGTVALGTAAYTKVNLTALQVNVGGFTISGSSLIVPKNGVYLIGASINFQTVATGSALIVGVGINTGTTMHFNARVYNTIAGNWVVNAQRPYNLSAGDALSLMAYSTAAGNIAGDTSDVTFLWATMLAAT